MRLTDAVVLNSTNPSKFCELRTWLLIVMTANTAIGGVLHSVLWSMSIGSSLLSLPIRAVAGAKALLTSSVVAPLLSLDSWFSVIPVRLLSACKRDHT